MLYFNTLLQEGLTLLKEHAKEARETLESSVNQNFDTPDRTGIQGINFEKLKQNSQVHR
jgi:hypothetical protein